MNLYFRLLYLLIVSRFGKRLSILDRSAINLRVLPNDLDLNNHLNNGRYAAFMDLGRLDLMQRSGLLKVVRRNKWVPVVADLKLNFKRPLKLGQKVELMTQLVFWDRRWLYLKQEFMVDGKLCAVGWVKGQLRNRVGYVSNHMVFASVGFESESPKMPEEAPWLARAA